MDAIPLYRRSASLNAMLTSIVNMMEPYASGASLSLDEDKIACAIGTLIGNALRPVPRGTFFHPGGEIIVRAENSPETDRVFVEVIDDGPGIPSDKLPLLFQPAPYQRCIGYALILAREIVEGHGGRMEAESTDDPHTHGTTIRLVLPAS